MTTHRSKPGRLVRRAAAVLSATALAIGLAAGPASAYHTLHVLDCGAAGSYKVETASLMPLERAGKFDTPAPWSGVLLLEDTTRVFKAFSVVTPRWSVYMPAVEHLPGDVISCTLSEPEGYPNFPWLVTGFFVP